MTIVDVTGGGCSMGQIREIGRLDYRKVYRFDVSSERDREIFPDEETNPFHMARSHVLTFCCAEDSSASPDADFWTTDVVFSKADDSPMNNREDYGLIWEPGDWTLGEEEPGELEDYGIWVRHSLDGERASLVPQLVDAFYRH